MVSLSTNPPVFKSLQQFFWLSYLFFMKTKLKVLLKVVLMRSARQRLKMKIFVTVLILWFSNDNILKVLE